jgi:hypothetical protein
MNGGRMSRECGPARNPRVRVLLASAVMALAIVSFSFAQTVVPATVRIDPGSLNLKSKGKWVSCTIELASSYDVHNVDLSTVCIEGIDPIYAETKPVSLRDANKDGITDLMVKFSRAKLVAALAGTEGDQVVTVTGAFSGSSDTTFTGTATIHVIAPKPKKPK